MFFFIIYIDNFTMVNMVIWLAFLYVFIIFVSSSMIIYIFCYITLQLQDHVIDDAVDDINEDGDAEHIFGQLRIDMETKNQPNVTDEHII